MRGWIRLAVLSCLLGSAQAQTNGPADENSDLNLIPNTLESHQDGRPPSSGHSTLSGKAYIEDVVTGWVNRTDLRVPLPADAPAWQNRTSLDLSYHWHPQEKIDAALSDRLNGLSGDTIDFPSRRSARNDFREGFVSYEALPRTYLAAGRVNLKNGTALGYNPTDFFKTRTAVNLASIDPSALREDRLGVVMIQGQKIWDGGAATVAYAPRLRSASPLSAASPPSLDPLFGQTNSTDRSLATLSCEIDDYSPQALVFHDDVGTHWGANLSRVLGSSVVGYLEWSGVREASLTTRAVAFGQNTGTLPPGIPLAPQDDSGRRFQNDLALGASWTSSFKLTMNLEYHYHQAGFTGGDFNHWVSLGSGNSRLSSELWFIRQYASDQQEPLMQHELFLRLDYPDVIASKLNLGAVAFISPYDASTLVQTSAQYFISRSWTVGVYLGSAVGSPGSEKGSLPAALNGALQLVWYL